ncbi:MAG: OmpA family protein [Bacteriovoracaceae bacterium]|jgi:chemotaxis protein MotB|nr:OmpA family protein [Bacteriovoracaceae bacterium]
MSEYKYHFEDELELEEDEKSTSNGEDAWVTSFADVVTVLLCFFIVFYIMEKQLRKTRGFGNLSGTVQAYQGKATTQEVKTLVETVRSLPDVKLVNTDAFLEIHFPPASFFNKGKTKISEMGMKYLKEVSPSLGAIGNRFYIQIQGYSDPTPVKQSKRRWWNDNMQLSVQRSLEVYNTFIELGIKKENLSITGFSDHRPLEGESEQNQRRITVRIEPKDYEKNY